MVLNGVVFSKSLNSFIKENFIILKIMRSLIIAPIPPKMAARKIFSGFNERKIPIAKGVVNPKENNMPAMRILKYPRFFIKETEFSK